MYILFIPGRTWLIKKADSDSGRSREETDVAHYFHRNRLLSRNRAAECLNETAWKKSVILVCVGEGCWAAGMTTCVSVCCSYCERERKQETQKKQGRDGDERGREGREPLRQRGSFITPVSVFVRLPTSAAGILHFQLSFNIWQKEKGNCRQATPLLCFINQYYIIFPENVRERTNNVRIWSYSTGWNSPWVDKSINSLINEQEMVPERHETNCHFYNLNVLYSIIGTLQKKNNNNKNYTPWDMIKAEAATEIWTKLRCYGSDYHLLIFIIENARAAPD